MNTKHQNHTTQSPLTGDLGVSNKGVLQQISQTPNP